MELGLKNVQQEKTDLENQVNALKAQKHKLENDLQSASQQIEQMKAEVNQLNEKATHLGKMIDYNL